MQGAAVPADLLVSVVTVAELRAGVLTATDVSSRDVRLATLSIAQALEALPIDDAVGAAWARLRVLLRDAGRRLPINDSWIAATALALRIPVVTQDDDYDEAAGIGGLEVIKA